MAKILISIEYKKAPKYLLEGAVKALESEFRKQLMNNPTPPDSVTASVVD